MSFQVLGTTAVAKIKNITLNEEKQIKQVASFGTKIMPNVGTYEFCAAWYQRREAAL